MIRVARATDAAAIAAVEARAAFHPWSLSSIAETLEQPTHRGFVGGDPVVGHLLATCVADEGEILTVAVLPEHRRRGLGRSLVVACEDWWRERDALAGWLEVRADNEGAKELYARQGWVLAHVRKAYYSDGCDAMVMRWSPSISGA